MPTNYGISFQPGGDETQNGQGQPPLQEAIQLLNLRLPRVLGAQAPVNQALLSAPGLQGQPDTTFLRQLLGTAFADAGAPGGGRRAPVGGGGGFDPTYPNLPGGNIVPFSPSPTPRPDRGVDYSAGTSQIPRFIIDRPRRSGDEGIF